VRPQTLPAETEQELLDAMAARIDSVRRALRDSTDRGLDMAACVFDPLTHELLDFGRAPEEASGADDSGPVPVPEDASEPAVPEDESGPVPAETDPDV
jgi:hypothetical protein